MYHTQPRRRFVGFRFFREGRLVDVEEPCDYTGLTPLRLTISGDLCRIRQGGTQGIVIGQLSWDGASFTGIDGKTSDASASKEPLRYYVDGMEIEIDLHPSVYDLHPSDLDLKNPDRIVNDRNVGARPFHPPPNPRFDSND